MSMTVLRPELNILLPPNSKGGEKYLSRPRSRHAMALRSKLEEIGLVDLMLHYWLYTGYKYLVSRGPARRAQYTQLTCSLLKKAHTSRSIIFKHTSLSNLFNFVLFVPCKNICVPRVRKTLCPKICNFMSLHPKSLSARARSKSD